MIDIKKLRDEFDATAAALARRGVEKCELEKARDLDAKRRALYLPRRTPFAGLYFGLQPIDGEWAAGSHR